MGLVKKHIRLVANDEVAFEVSRQDHVVTMSDFLDTVWDDGKFIPISVS